MNTKKIYLMLIIFVLSMNAGATTIKMTVINYRHTGVVITPTKSQCVDSLSPGETVILKGYSPYCYNVHITFKKNNSGGDPFEWCFWHHTMQSYTVFVDNPPTYTHIGNFTCDVDMGDSLCTFSSTSKSIHDEEDGTSVGIV